MTLNLVTGGAGFVGRHLVEALKARGEAVRVLDLAPCDLAETVIGSIDDPSVAARSVADVDAVFHLAGNAQLWARDEKAFERINHLGTRTMLEASRAAGVRRFIHCSSLTTLVGAKTPIGASAADESARLAPEDMLGAYPRSKLLAERAVEKAGLDAVIAIPTEPLGPGDESLTPPTRMILDLVAGKTPATIDCMLNFVDVRSLADGLIAARGKGRRGERYLLGGENVSMRRLLSSLEKLTGKKMPRAELPYAVALAAGVIDTKLVTMLTGKPPKAPLTGVRLAGRRVEFSSVRAKTELGWESAPFEAALKSALDWFSERGMVS
ncbi:MAG TPA: NAD-dependent epimerase/dehydratase family protein [Parvularculaceae bacterium]|nr:NAD-dependent epimerase/dehydratase family protein [Parvularculaceae bacterium]